MNDSIRNDDAVAVEGAPRESLSIDTLDLLRHTVMDPFGAVDMNGYFIGCNTALEELLGYSDEELRGLTFEAITPPSQHAGEAAILQSQVLQRGYSDVYSKTLIRKDGSMVDIELRTALFRDSCGKPAGMWAVLRDVTARTQAESALRSSEELFRRAFEHLPVGACLVGLDYRFQRCNQALCSLLDYAEEELVGKSFLELTHHDDKGIGIDDARRIASGNQGQAQFSKRYLRKDGETVWAELTVTAVRSVEGRMLHYLGIIIDITARKKVEDALRESEAKLQAVFRSSKDAVSVAKGAVVVFANPAYLALFGFSSLEEVAGRPFIDRIAPEYRELIRTSVEDRLAGRPAPDLLEVRAIRRDGTDFLLEISPTTFELDKDRLTLAVLRDITARKTAETALAKSEEKFSKSFAMSPQSTTITRVDTGVFVDVNRAFTEITGYRREEVVGKSREDLGLWVDSKHLSKYLRQVRSGKPFRGLLAQYRTKSGQIREGLLTSEYFEIDGVVYSLNFVNDVTDRNAAERELRQTHAELEARVAERTARLEEALQELESFSYSVSHDLRSPLRTLDGFSRILLQDYSAKLDADGKHYLNRIVAAADKMGSLVDNLLALARINRAEMQNQVVDLSSIAGDTIQKLREQDPDRKVAVSITRDIHVNGDPVLLQSVMENLLGNAWKYTRKNPAAKIKFGKRSEKGRDVFYVKDDGIGFDMAHADKLFGVFQRLHGESEYPGIGVGLATASRIVRRHRGEIWVDAKPGEGATFFFTLGDR